MSQQLLNQAAKLRARDDRTAKKIRSRNRRVNRRLQPFQPLLQKNKENVARAGAIDLLLAQPERRSPLIVLPGEKQRTRVAASLQVIRLTGYSNPGEARSGIIRIYAVPDSEIPDIQDRPYQPTYFRVHDFIVAQELTLSGTGSVGYDGLYNEACEHVNDRRLSPVTALRRACYLRDKTHELETVANVLDTMELAIADQSLNPRIILDSQVRVS